MENTAENVDDLYESLIEYLSGFMVGVSAVGFEIRKSSVINFDKLKDIVNGIEWINTALFETKSLHEINLKDNNFSKILKDIENGIWQTDEIFLADILEYDILEELGDIYEKIRK